MGSDRLNIIYRGAATKHLLEHGPFVDILSRLPGSAATTNKALALSAAAALQWYHLAAVTVFKTLHYHICFSF